MDEGMPLLVKDQFIDLAMLIRISHHSNKVGEKFEEKNNISCRETGYVDDFFLVHLRSRK